QEAAQRHRVGAAQGDHPGGDRVGAEGEAPDRAHLELAAAVEDEPGGEVQPAPLEGDLLAVEVEVAAPAAAEQEVAEAEGAALEERLQLGPQIVVAHVPSSGLQRSTGRRAAWTSSTRSTGASCGADWTRPRSASASATMAARMSARPSRLRRDSVSVGSNIIASGTVVGK